MNHINAIFREDKLLPMDIDGLKNGRLILVGMLINRDMNIGMILSRNGLIIRIQVLLLEEENGKDVVLKLNNRRSIQQYDFLYVKLGIVI